MILWCSVLLVLLGNYHIKAEISIDSDGGYKNIVIGISPNRNRTDIESILSQLKTLFREASQTLFTASKRNFFFKEIVFVIPKKYKAWISGKLFQIDRNGAASFRRPDFYLTHDDVFERPYTSQHRGCGNPGLRIHIPRDFLDSEFEKKALTIVRQWAHYRYGVFSENGFPEDEIYPDCYRIPGSNGDIRINDCTNEKAVYDIGESESTCNPVPILGKNDPIISSIMTNMDFPKMSYFCDNDKRSHNQNAPNKQNALCRQKSTWEVISAGEDFKIKSKHTSNVKPAFKYFVESDPSFVVAVDTSSEMDLNADRMIMTLNAFTYFVFYDLPFNSTIRLTDMNSNDTNIIERTIQSENDAKKLIELFPETGGKEESCVHCTIQKLLEIMKVDVNDIIIITATDITDSWIDNITVMLKSNKVALHVIYFEKMLKSPVLLERVAKNSGGNFFYIPETPGSPVSSILLLYEAFRMIYESVSWMNRQRVLVDQMTFTDNCLPNCFLSFPVDRTLQTLQVIVTGTDFGRNSVLRNSIILENGIQHYISGNDSFTYKVEVPAYVITVENPQEGRWNLSFERKPGFNKPVVAIVRGTSRDYGDIINMQAWISENYKNIDNSDRPPITLYSEIKKHNRPVTDVKVMAFIYQATLNHQWSLELNDDGVGDPDITRYDGIYSRYLTDIAESGYYSITVVAEKKTSQYHNTEQKKGNICCGSFISDDLSYASGPFKRVTTYQSFFVDESKTKVIYPPRRVLDLRILGLETLSNNIRCYVLKWTAPGEHYDKGTALSYDIKVFKTREDALNDFHKSYALTIEMLNIQGPLLEPKEAGIVQTVYVELTNLTSGTYFIALKTTSHSGKVSDVSNVVELTYIEEDSFVTGIGFSKGEYYTFPISRTTETTPDSDESSSTKVKLAVGLSCGILLLLLIAALILLLCMRRNKKSKTEPNPAIICQNTKKTESSDALCHSNGNGNISIISPVTSWDANSLVSRYETLQQRKPVGINGMLTLSENIDTDNVSLPSSKYSYDKKIEQDSSIYDPIYYHQVQSQDELNYPYNPSYTPFNPMYTSSTRRLDMVNNPYCSDNASYCSYSMPRNQSSRLKTDV